ncbi:NAD-dependent protein deacetylase, SIR2 family [Marinospirillum celere]|uniref:protein acetyllysine N-acetyltransferase n=1 Tax=Marinospirillum celere TaxID=1122252 RepID=A0A1I1FQ74_9GAMM|nr:NAD-dependent protein deacetylase [Marinospirillum celere]SFC01607.1 NAD-dependent protein deacetylase, SIR2 family [Marinospirillum celere]
MQLAKAYPASFSVETTSNQLFHFFNEHHKWLVLTGAGISTGSGIPDYRDDEGQWKRRQPVQHQEFMTSPQVRQRYWARALAGFEAFRSARPGAGHLALAALEKQGRIQQVITQNVDRLHQKAGSKKVIDLHGRGDTVSCQSCGFRTMRYAYHQHLIELNPQYDKKHASLAPDGDADLEQQNFSDFQLLDCPRCSGIIKPDVVFFGDLIPPATRHAAEQAMQAADGLLVVGSSLMVYSGYRFCRLAKQTNKPIIAINRGKTRADELLDLKVNQPAESILTRLADL